MSPRAAEPSEVTVPVMSECVQALMQHQEGHLLDTGSQRRQEPGCGVNGHGH